MDDAASEQSGHAVLVPMDRGYCWRSAWDTQQKCGAAQPGPRAKGTPSSSTVAYTDATVPWEALGQRGDGTESRYTPPTHTVRLEIVGTGAPSSLGNDERSNGALELPILDGDYMPEKRLNNSERTRAMSDLVQLRTGGFLTYNEFVTLRGRVNGGRRVTADAGTLGDLNAAAASGGRMHALHQIGLVTNTEYDLLSQR